MVNNVKLFNEITDILKDFLNENEFREFLESFSDPRDEIDSEIVSREIDNIQLDMELPAGYDKRILVDKVSSLTEGLLSKSSYLQLLVNLTEKIIDYSEFDIAIDLIDDIFDKSRAKNNYELIKAKTFILSAKVNWSQGIWDEAFADTRQAQTIYKEIKHNDGLADCENMRGTIYAEKGEIDKALNHLKIAQAYLEKSNNEILKAKIEINLGIMADLKGKFEEAINYYNTSLQVFKKLNDTFLTARIYHNLGMINIKLENYSEAIRYFDECINLSLPNEYLSNCVISFLGKAFVYTKTGDQSSADMFSDKAMEIADRINDTLSIADVYKLKGMIQSSLNNFDFSEEMFENSLRLNEDFDNKLTLAETNKEMSNLYTKVNSILKAEMHKEESKKFLDKNNLSSI